MPRTRTIALAFLITLPLTGLGVPLLRAQQSADRLGRQIRIMEKVIDQVLIESKHALVSGQPNCRGIRLQGYGVLFMVELSPIGSEGRFHFKFKDDGSYDIILDDKGDKGRKRTEGRQRNVGRRDAEQSDTTGDIEYEDEEAADKAAEKAKAEEREEQKKLAKWVEDLKKQAERGASDENPEREAALEQVREELLGVLRDYGHTITGVGSDEYVAIAIFPSDLDWRGLDTRSLLQVKRRTIDAYNEDHLTAEQFAKQVEVITQ